MDSNSPTTARVADTGKKLSTRLPSSTAHPGAGIWEGGQEVGPCRPPCKCPIPGRRRSLSAPRSSPAIMEKAIASGMSASATTRPASRSFRIFIPSRILATISCIINDPCFDSDRHVSQKHTPRGPRSDGTSRHPFCPITQLPDACWNVPAFRRPRRVRTKKIV